MANINIKKLNSDLNFQSDTGSVVAEWVANHVDDNHVLSVPIRTVAEELGISLDMVRNSFNHFKRGNLASYDNVKAVWKVNLDQYILAKDDVEKTIDQPENEEQHMPPNIKASWVSDSWDNYYYVLNIPLGKMKDIFSPQYLSALEKKIGQSISENKMIFLCRPLGAVGVNQKYRYGFITDVTNRFSFEECLIPEGECWNSKRLILELMQRFFAKHSIEDLFVKKEK